MLLHVPFRTTILPNTSESSLLRVYPEDVGIVRLPILAWKIDDYEGWPPRSCEAITFDDGDDQCMDFIVSHSRYYRGDESFDTEDGAIQHARSAWAAKGR